MKRGLYPCISGAAVVFQVVVATVIQAIVERTVKSVHLAEKTYRCEVRMRLFEKRTVLKKSSFLKLCNGEGLKCLRRLEIFLKCERKWLRTESNAILMGERWWHAYDARAGSTSGGRKLKVWSFTLIYPLYSFKISLEGFSRKYSKKSTERLSVTTMLFLWGMRVAYAAEMAWIAKICKCRVSKCPCSKWIGIKNTSLLHTPNCAVYKILSGIEIFFKFKRNWLRTESNAFLMGERFRNAYGPRAGSRTVRRKWKLWSFTPIHLLLSFQISM